MRRAGTRTSRISRRSFLSTAATLAGAASATDLLAAGRNVRQQAPPSYRVALAVVGAGGRGADNIREAAAAGADIVALCDCDEQNAAESFAKYAKARKYRDWRRMLDAEKGIDAVLVATPDHSHAIVSIAAMQLGSTADGARGGRVASGDSDGNAGARVRRHPARGRSPPCGGHRRRHRAARLDGPARGLVAAGRAPAGRHVARAGHARLGCLAGPRARAAVQPR